MVSPLGIGLASIGKAWAACQSLVAYFGLRRKASSQAPKQGGPSAHTGESGRFGTIFRPGNGLWGCTFKHLGRIVGPPRKKAASRAAFSPYPAG